jgi:hypothetical protein
MGRFSVKLKARRQWTTDLPQAFYRSLPAFVATHAKSPLPRDMNFDVVARLQP